MRKSLILIWTLWRQEKSGDVDGALKDIKAYSHSHGDKAELYYQWGRCFDAVGEYQEAFNKYEQSSRLTQSREIPFPASV